MGIRAVSEFAFGLSSQNTSFHSPTVYNASDLCTSHFDSNNRKYFSSFGKKQYKYMNMILALKLSTFSKIYANGRWSVVSFEG